MRTRIKKEQIAFQGKLNAKFVLHTEFNFKAKSILLFYTVVMIVMNICINHFI